MKIIETILAMGIVESLVGLLILASVVLVICCVPWPLAKQNLQGSDEVDQEEKIVTPVYGEGDLCPRCSKELLQVVSRELSTDDSFASPMAWIEISCPACGVVAEQSLC